MAKRFSKTAAAVPTEQEAQEKMRLLAENQAKQRAMTADMDLALQKVRKKYEASLETLKREAAELQAGMELWAMHNPEVFQKRKSLEWMHGTIGYRLGTPKVPVPRGMQDQILGVLKSMGLMQFIRTAEEIDKQAIIAAREDEQMMSTLASAGLRVTQEEKFFVETKTEEPAAV